jgi:hypothetical protein
MKTITKYIFAAILSISLAACSEEFFDVDNNGVATADDLADLAAKNPDAILDIVQPLQVGIYSYMITYGGTSHYDFGWVGLVLHAGDVMNDDVALHSNGNGMYTFDYQLDYWGEQYVKAYLYWNFCYTLVAKANDIIAKIDPETPSAELKAILGQSFAIRALGHAYAAQMYQQTYIGNENAPGVPILLTNAEEGTNTGRAPLADVYAQVEKDFKTAVDFLDGWERPNKVYIDKQVAAGLYARICLVTNNWADAITYARIAREDYPIFTTTELLADGFNNISSKEWIWGADITGETTTMFASFFSFVCSFDAGYGGDVGCYRKMDKKLYDAMSATDVRRQQFKVGNNVSTVPGTSAFPDYTNIKFKKVDNWLADYVFMRSSEMVLTEAEALARSGQEGQAATVLRELMTNRDPAWNATTVTGEQVYQQRRVELWAEGFSLFDHLRLKKGIDRSYAGSNHYAPVQYKISAGSWYFLYQIPLRELDNNPDISPSEQNPAPTGTKFE